MLGVCRWGQIIVISYGIYNKLAFHFNTFRKTGCHLYLVLMFFRFILGKKSLHFNMWLKGLLFFPCQKLMEFHKKMVTIFLWDFIIFRIAGNGSIFCQIFNCTFFSPRMSLRSIGTKYKWYPVFLNVLK